MNKVFKTLALAALGLVLAPVASAETINLPTAATVEGAQIIPLSSMDLTQTTVGWGTVKANKSIDGRDLTMKGDVYTSGVGTHASAKIVVKLNGAAVKFHAALGIDDEVKNAAVANGNTTVKYDVILRGNDGKETSMGSGLINGKDAEVVTIDLDNLTDYKYLILDFDNYNGDGYDHVDVGNAYFEYLYQNSNPPEIVNEKVLSTGLFGATTLFSQPGVKFMQKLRVQDDAAKITVKNLPAGLTFNEKRCLVEGVIDKEGTYEYTAVITMGEESVEQLITLTVSSNLTMPTPLMGWISWNVVQSAISNSVIETVADAMVSSGLRDAGYNYIIIDDLWHASSRAADGKPVADPAKFPKGMKAASDYTHERGIKFGIYSDAANRTCAGAFGSYGYEEIDARQYAEWGVDLLKYDYCSAPADVATAKTRYKTMSDALKNSGRDIAFYICEWGVREPWKWGCEAGGTLWRATYDTRDCWNGASGGIGILQSIAGMKDIWPYNGVNRWNDADMMCVGIHGKGKSSSDLCATGPGMTQDEYRTQFSLWCMWSSPLTLSFDLRNPISDDDLAIMANPELIAINQDRMGQAAELIYEDANFVVFAKDLENGDVAISATNLSNISRNYTFDFSKISALDPEGSYTVRDVVNHADLDPATEGTYTTPAKIKSHATVVYRLHSDSTVTPVNPNPGPDEPDDTPKTVWLSELGGFENVPCGAPAADGLSAHQNANAAGNPIVIDGITYDKGIGTHAEASFAVDLKGNVSSFHAIVGVDQAKQSDYTNKANHGCFDYEVVVINKYGVSSTAAGGSINGKNGPKSAAIDLVNLAGARYLILKLTKGADGQIWADWADWADANLTYADKEAPEIVSEEYALRDASSSIDAVAAPRHDETIYDLQGRRVASPARGIYIVNGQKTKL